MKPTTFIEDYEQSRDASYSIYHASSHDNSEYQERDYKAGYADGYQAGGLAAIQEISAGNTAELRNQAAIAAMQGALSNDTWMSNTAEDAIKAYGTKKDLMEVIAQDIATFAIKCADALINELNTPQQ